MRVLEKLEVSKYPDENLPVGGYGAGIVVLLDDGGVFSEKVGKTTDSPVAQLADIVKPKLLEAKILISHVRYPSLEFMDTVQFKETAQPYIENFEPELTLVSAHNGRIENYADIRDKLGTHVFESEKIRLIDSEIIPHYFGALLEETGNGDQAAHALMDSLKGKTVGSIALLQLDEENQILYLLHKGWSRGLTVWTNDKDEVIFCTRPEPVKEELKEMLSERCFKEKVMIKPKEEAEINLSFSISS